MAHPNEQLYLARFLTEFPSTDWPEPIRSARILNVGCKGPHRLDYQAMFPNQAVVGLDEADGRGVDIVCDVAGDCTVLRGEQFGVILCCSVLEHCIRPWRAASNLAHHLLPGGWLYVSVPWIWRYHSYPKDYWRFSAQAIAVLFPTIRWERSAYCTQRKGEFFSESPVEEPYRVPQKNGRVYLASQLLCMIGRNT